MAARLNPILMDNREPRMLMLAMRAGLGERLEILRLDQADYVVTDRCGCSIGIERKTITDCLASIQSGRLVTQLHRTHRGYAGSALLIEGILKTFVVPNRKGRCVTHGGTGRWSLASLQMMLWSAQGHGARLLWSTGHPDTVDTLRALMERGDKKCLIGSGSLE